MGRNILIYPEVTSTNDLAKARVCLGEPEGTVIIAEQQTKGRGRYERKWVSFAGQSISMSLIFRFKPVDFKPALFSVMSTVALACAIKKFVTDDIFIKWPNDLIINHKKFCGILSESGFAKNKQPYLILGIGINVNIPQKEIQKISGATSLLAEQGQEFDRTEIIIEVINNLEKHYLARDYASLITACKNMSYTLGKKVKIKQKDKVVIGIAKAISGDGFLVLEDVEQKVHKIISGDVVSCS